MIQTQKQRGRENGSRSVVLGNSFSIFHQFTFTYQTESGRTLALQLGHFISIFNLRTGKLESEQESNIDICFIFNRNLPTITGSKDSKYLFFLMELNCLAQYSIGLKKIVYTFERPTAIIEVLSNSSKAIWLCEFLQMIQYSLKTKMILRKITMPEGHINRQIVMIDSWFYMIQSRVKGIMAIKPSENDQNTVTEIQIFSNEDWRCKISVSPSRTIIVDQDYGSKVLYVTILQDEKKRGFSRQLEDQIEQNAFSQDERHYVARFSNNTSLIFECESWKKVGYIRKMHHLVTNYQRLLTGVIVEGTYMKWSSCTPEVIKGFY